MMQIFMVASDLPSGVPAPMTGNCLERDPRYGNIFVH